FQLDSFDKGDYQKSVEQENLARTLTRVLYPNDNYLAGKELRLRQQYFFVSASLQAAIARYKRGHKDIRKLYEKAVFHMNDTHPTLTVPELMRLLLDEEKLEWDEAWEVVSKSCAYTNHTIMSEALEKWPIELFKRLLPRVYQIVDEINRRFVEQIRAKYPGDEGRVARMAILYNGEVRMANLAIAGGFSVNGVAQLHTEILEKRELHDFYEMMPEKFSNKTNGVTQRRFLLHGDPLLSDWITKHVGKEWITDLEQIRKLEKVADNKKEQEEVLRIKRANKERLADYILENTGIEVNPDSIFDVQVKRLHEYKRQLLNILHVMYLYNKVKDNPDMPFVPRTFIFGAKASAAYNRAKLIIRLINNVASVINADESIKGKIKVVFIEDYRVSNAEIIFAASDVSEQISTASREASGTSNMKFMMNGALTLGTMDGANVEIVEEVGEDNAFIFGLSAEQVIEYERYGNYNPYQYVESDWELRRVLDQLVDGTYSGGDREMFRDLHNSLLVQQGGRYPDIYFILADFRSYAQAQERVEAKYRDRNAWAKSMILNIARSGKFSSDRTIQEYVDDIWHLDKMIVK
ncbi:MAG: glycogen/starch/alpha-glucan phosphorylase, partial [Eubacterium sp.]|nr:glycogen/starch/alpha-glucan phosphorylase [Eubacterium sp.]